MPGPLCSTGAHQSEVCSIKSLPYRAPEPPHICDLVLQRSICIESRFESDCLCHIISFGSSCLELHPAIHQYCPISSFEFSMILLPQSCSRPLFHLLTTIFQLLSAQFILYPFRPSSSPDGPHSILWNLNHGINYLSATVLYQSSSLHSTSPPSYAHF